VERIAQYQLDEDFPSKTISFCAADSLTELPTLIHPSNAHFVLFLPIDGREVDAETIYSVSEKLLDQGMVYACVWGPDCESVHDSIDQPIFQRQPGKSGGSVVITTWRAKDPLSEAVWFFSQLRMARGRLRAYMFRLGRCRHWKSCMGSRDQGEATRGERRKREPLIRVLDFAQFPSEVLSRCCWNCVSKTML